MSDQPEYSPSPSQETPLILRSVNALWQASVAVTGTIGLALLAGWLAGSVAIGVLVGMVLSLVLLLLARTVQVARRRRAIVVLTHLQTAIEMRLPLTSTLRAWARGEHPKIARMLAELSVLLESGARVGDSLRRARIDLPPALIDRLFSAERAGHLQSASAEAIVVERRRRAVESTDGPFLAMYALLLLIAVPTLLWFIAEIVMPKYEQLFRDFKIALPAATRLVIALSQTVAPVLAALGVLLLINALRVAVREISLPNARRTSRACRAIVDRVRWITPIVHKIDRDRGLADICRTMGEALEAHRPLHEAIAEAHQPHLNRVLADRVETWAKRVDGGESVGSAAAAAQFPPLVSGLIGQSRSREQIASAMQFLCRYYDARFSRLQIVLRQSIVLLLALSAATCVLVMAISIFQPLCELIDKLSFIRIRP